MVNDNPESGGKPDLSGLRTMGGDGPEPAARPAPARPAPEGLAGLPTQQHGDDAAAGPTAQAQGQLFARRYRIEGLIGAGASGAVYRAHDTRMGQDVALKLLHPERLRSEAARRRLLAEALLTRNIRHRNVVAVFDADEADGVAYMVMELLEGQSLRTWANGRLAAASPCTMAEAVAVVEAILDGLEAAHAANVIHRDLKPENVQVTMSNGRLMRLAVLDFGVARATNELAERAGNPLGTAYYMAPEQITAPETVQASADIYSLSCIFYELLAGALPVGHWQPPSRGRKDVPPGIDKLIDDGLSKNRWGRPQTAAEFRDRMREALKPPEPRPEPKPQPAPQPPPQPQPQPQPRAATPPPPQPKAGQPTRPKIDAGGQALPKSVEAWLGDTEDTRPVPFSPGQMTPLSPDAEKQGASLIAKAQAVAEEGRLKFNDGAREAAKAKWIEAQNTFLLAIVRGSVEARYAYARFIEHMYVSIGSRYASVAREWLDAAARAGHVKAMTRLGWLSRSGEGGTRDRAAAWRLFNEAARAGEADALCGVAYMYLDEGKLEEGRKELRAYYEAVRKGGDVNAYALKRLAEMAIEGKGGPKDMNEAKAALTLGARQPFASECRKLMQQHFPMVAAMEKVHWKR